MDNDLLCFLQNVSLTEKTDEENETTIAIELKGLLNENDRIVVLLTYDGQPINKIIIRRKNDK